MTRFALFLFVTLASACASAQTFYYAPSMQLSGTSDVSAALGSLDAVQTARCNVVPLRVKSNGYGSPPDVVTYTVIAPATDTDDAPASTLPATSWTVGNCSGSYTLDGTGRNVWSATAYASVAAALTVRDSDPHIKDVAYVLTPVLPNTPALLVSPNLTLICH